MKPSALADWLNNHLGGAICLVIATGKQETMRERSEFKDIIKTLLAVGEWQELAEHIMSSPKFYEHWGTLYEFVAAIDDFGKEGK